MTLINNNLFGTLTVQLFSGVEYFVQYFGFVSSIFERIFFSEKSRKKIGPKKSCINNINSILEIRI